MLCQRRRQWTNTVPTLGERLVFPVFFVTVYVDRLQRVLCSPRIANGSPTLNQASQSCSLGRFEVPSTRSRNTHKKYVAALYITVQPYKTKSEQLLHFGIAEPSMIRVDLDIISCAH